MTRGSRRDEQAEFNLQSVGFNGGECFCLVQEVGAVFLNIYVIYSAVDLFLSLV